MSALVRRPGSEPKGTRPVPGDLTDAGALGEALDGERPELVVHLAAEIGSQRNAGKIREVNVEGMRRLLDACVGAGVRRVVFASTVVTGDARGEVLEEDRPLPVHTDYGRSKQEGERLLREADLEGVVIRPGHVYGPGGWYAEEIVNRLRQPGRFAVVGDGENWWDTVRVEDVARAIVDAAERAPAGETYHVADDEPVRYKGLRRPHGRRARRGAPAAHPGVRRPPGSGRGPGRRGRALGAHVEREDQARARLGAALRELDRGRARRGGTAHVGLTDDWFPAACAGSDQSSGACRPAAPARR